MSTFHAIYAIDGVRGRLRVDRHGAFQPDIRGAGRRGGHVLLAVDQFRRSLLRTRHRGQLGCPVFAPRDDDHRQRGPPDRLVRIHGDLVGQARQGFPAADHDPADTRHRARNGGSGQRDYGAVDRTGHPAGVRPAGDQPSAVSHRRGPRRQHRRRGNPGRRPDQHHHRHRSPTELHYVHRQYGAGGAYRPRRPAAPAAPAVSRLLHRRSRAGRRCHDAEREGSDPQSPAADPMRNRPGRSVRRIRHA